MAARQCKKWIFKELYSLKPRGSAILERFGKPVDGFPTGWMLEGKGRALSFEKAEFLRGKPP